MKDMTGRFFTYLACLSLLLFAGCEVEERFSESPAREAQEGKVTISGSLSIPMEELTAQTKSFGEYGTGTGITHLYIAIFNEGDILEEVVEARPGTKEHPLDNFTPGDAASNFLTVFHVTVTEAPARKRILHFIGTSVERQDLLAANIVDESTYAKTLIATGSEDCYWGRAEFADGLTEDTDIHDIPLVRNFVKVKVQSSDPSFTISGFKVFNVPTSGTIVPFNPNTAEYLGSGDNLSVNFNRFADYSVADITYQNMSGSGTGQQHYEGFMPSGVTYDNLSGLSPGYNAFGTTDYDFAAANFVAAGGADYLYEATHLSSENNPFIIVKGSYNGNADTYYKADFVYSDSDGETQYYHLLRNFQYTLDITKVMADGSGTIMEAVNGVALNNFEASTQSQYLTNISDGDSRLFVSSTDELIVRGTTLTMYVKSLKKSGSTWVNDNANIEVKAVKRTGGSGDITSGISIGTSDESYNGDSGWRKVIITVADAADLHPGEVWKQTITFKNKGADGADGTAAEKADDLTRNLNLTLRRPLDLSVDVQDYVPAVAGSACRVDFSIPSGLTSFRFPMYFYIEQENNTLYPQYLAPGAMETLSVVTGKSNIPGQSDVDAYYYQRILTWDEYSGAAADVNGIKTFSSYFKSLVAGSATTVWVFPADGSDYFNTWDSVNSLYINQDSFVNDLTSGDITFERNNVLLSLADDPTTVNKGTANSGAAVSYSSSNPAVVTVGGGSGLLTAVSTGTATITATCEASGAYTAASKSFTVTVLASGGLDISWKNEPSRVLIPGAAGKAEAKVTLIGGASQSGTTQYTSSNTSVATIASDGNITAVAAGTTVITATAFATIGGYDGTFEQDISYTLTVAASGDVTSGTAYHTETFLGGTLGDYTVDLKDGTGFSSGKENIWYYGGELYGAEASARNGSGGLAASWLPGESWLISKAFDMRSTDGAALRFTHTANYFNVGNDADAAGILAKMKSCLTVWYSTDNGSSWTQIVIPDDQYPTGTSWASQDVNVNLPAAVNGASSLKIAFKYVSTAADHGTWQVKNVTIVEQ